MKKRHKVMFLTSITWLLLVALMVMPASALELNPLDFSSLGNLSATTDLVINSDTRQMTGGAAFLGITDSATGATVFAFDAIQTSNISIIGATPLAILSKGTATFDGLINSLLSSDLELASVGTMNVSSLHSFGAGSIWIFAPQITSGNLPPTGAIPVIQLISPGEISLPVPAAVWLFGSGLTVLVGFAGRRASV